MRTNPYSPSFNAGELSPRLHARTDFSKYRNGVAICLNLIPLAEGGLMRRAGSRFVAELKSSANKGRLKRFEFSTTQAYQIEMCDFALRFYKNQARIATVNITGSIANGTFDTDLTSWTDKDTGGSAASTWNAAGYMALVGDATEYAWRQQTVASITNGLAYTMKFRVRGAPGSDVALRIGTSDGGTQIVNDRIFQVGYHVYTFTATATTIYIGFRALAARTVGIDDVSFLDNAPVEVDAPWAIADVYQVEGPQSADVLYLFHASYPTYKLLRYGHTSWSLVEVPWEDGPWLPENPTEDNTTPTTLTFSAATGYGVTVTASSTSGINDDEGFKTTDIGRSIRLSEDSTINWGWAVIVGWTSTTVVTADVKRTVAVTTAEKTWRLGAWSGTTGYASCGAFFEQRLFAAGSSHQPQSFWASQTADAENMSPDSENAAGTAWDGTVEDDDALDYTISADEVNAIKWMSSGDDTMVIGTTGGEWKPSSNGAVLTPSDIVVRRQTTHGSAAVQPVRIDSTVLFVQKAARKIREFAFSFDTNGYQALDMTRLANHITAGGISELAFAEEPNSLVYYVRADGTLCTMTYRREEDVVGHARHILGGSFGSGNAVVESVSVIPGTNGAGQVQDSTHRDEVWLIVKRTINGSTKRYIEVLEEDFEGPVPGEYDDEDDWTAAMLDAQTDAYYVDSVITYDSTATTSITGLDHLEGQTVKILADGATHPDKTVTSGAITLEIEASTVQVGLGYTHRMKTLKFEGGTQAGTAVGRTKKVYGLTFVLLDSATLSFGPDADNLREVDFREVADEMDSAAPLFTGEYYQKFDGKWQTDPRMFLESDSPMPFTLLALAPQTDTKELV